MKEKTPKEEAKELVDKFEYAKKYSNTTNAMSKELAKECALIAVDEIIVNGFNPQLPYNYWELVKQEIEKL